MCLEECMGALSLSFLLDVWFCLQETSAGFTLCVCVFYFLLGLLCSDLRYFLPYAKLRFAVFLVPWGSVLDYLESISFIGVNLPFRL